MTEVRKAGPLVSHVMALAMAGAMASGARAQEATEARAAFAEAQDAVADGRLTQARDLYQRSLSLEPRVPTAFNLTGVLRAVGELLAAERLLDETLGGRYGALRGGQRSAVTELLAAIRAEVAVVHVTVRGAVGVSLRVDGRAMTTLDDGASFTIRVDPGQRIIAAVTRDGRSDERTVELDRGQSVELELEIPAALPEEQDEAGDTGPAPESEPLASVPPASAGLSTAQASGVVSLSVGVASGIAALVTGLLSHAIYTDLESECSPDGGCPKDREGDINEGASLATASTVLSVIAAGTGVLGVSLLLFGGEDGEERVHLSPYPGGLRLRGRF